MIVLFLLFLILVTVFAKVSESSANPKWLLNKPADFTNSLSTVQNLDEYVALIPERRKGAAYHFADDEDYNLIDFLFYGKVGGVIMEMGACDGTVYTGSKSVTFEPLGWKRILIDANVKWISRLKSENKQAMSVWAAVCEYETVVHYAKTRNYLVSGVLEFMSDDFMKKYHPTQYFYRGTAEFNHTGWTAQLSHQLYEIPCIPLTKILSYAEIDHISAFILDVEGGEWSVLQSIDWDSVIFDVIAVETDPSERPPGYANKIATFMEQKGYRCIAMKHGRNTWFAHKSFVPSLKAGLSSPFNFD